VCPRLSLKSGSFCPGITGVYLHAPLAIQYYLGNNNKEKSLYIFSKDTVFWVFLVCSGLNPQMQGHGQLIMCFLRFH
jgi:hypothetical protein